MVDDPFAGRIIGGRYQVQSRVGQGGMATVYKAYDPNLRRVVAVKIIHPHLSESPDFIRRFEDEATVVGQLRHPNIPVVYDFNHDSNGYYIVMEYIDGESLENRLRTLSGTGQRLPVETAARMMIDMCEAVHFAHQHGVIHRDIKPANISIDRQDKVYLMDFGIAKILGGQQHTATGLMVGSAHYMAPEQIQGLSVDARSDIYALGVTLFEMLNGKPPFQADFGDDGDDDAPERPGAGYPWSARRGAPGDGDGDRPGDGQEPKRTLPVCGRNGRRAAPNPRRDQARNTRRCASCSSATY